MLSSSHKESLKFNNADDFKKILLKQHQFAFQLQDQLLRFHFFY